MIPSWDDLIRLSQGTKLEPVFMVLKNYEYAGLVPDEKVGFKIVPTEGALDWEILKQDHLVPVAKELVAFFRDLAQKKKKGPEIIYVQDEGRGQRRDGVWSFSRLSKFQTCPRAFYYAYVLRIPEPDTPALQFGKLVHDVLAEALAYNRKPEELVAQKINSYNLLDPAKDGQEAVRITEDFLRNFVPAPGISRIWLEKKLEGRIGEEKVAGYGDLIEEGDDEIIITDFKTNWEPYEVNDTFQLGLYALLAQQQPEWSELKKISVRLWFLRNNEIKAADLAPTQIQEVADQVQGIIASIKDAMTLPGPVGFSPKPGHLCRYCSYAVQCLGLDSEIYARSIQEDETENLAGLYLRLDAARQLIQKELQKRTPPDSPIHLNGEIIGEFSRTVWTFQAFQDLQSAIEVLTSYGEKPEELFSIDGWKVKKLLTKPNLSEKLRALGKEQEFRYFGHKKGETNEAEN